MTLDIDDTCDTCQSALKMGSDAISMTRSPPDGPVTRCNERFYIGRHGDGLHGAAWRLEVEIHRRINSLWTEPLTTIASIGGASVPSRILASPATAKSMATWSHAYELAVTKPMQGTRAGLMIASRGLGTAVADKLGMRLPVNDLLQHIPQLAGAQGQHDDRRGVP